MGHITKLDESVPDDDSADVAVREYRHTTDSSQDGRGSEGSG